MVRLTEEYINSMAPNQNAIVNGWGLVKKNSFVKLSISSDETLIFGECQGSGSSNYVTSADFVNPENPVFRCTCPSRQFPCKHALGLMFAYVSGKKFVPADTPADILEKREKAEKREEKKKNTKTADTEGQPKKINKTALTKKIHAQLEGLELLEKITHSITQSGLGTINAKTLQVLEDQAKQLGNYYLPGVQTALRELILLFKGTGDTEKAYTRAVDSLIKLYSLAKKGKEHLNKRLADPELSLDAGSTLDELLGHAWQLAELKEANLVQNQVELVQLAFNSYVSEARQEFVDAGLWLNLTTGQVLATRNYRPFKAAKYIREEDSFYSVVQAKELFIYPGGMNPRARWESMTVRALAGEDYPVLRSWAKQSYQEILKEVKNQLKNPLAGKHTAALLHYTTIGTTAGKYVMENSRGERIQLADYPDGCEPPSTQLLPLLPPDCLLGQVALVRFHHDLDTNRLTAQPLSIITPNRIIRLIY